MWKPWLRGAAAAIGGWLGCLAQSDGPPLDVAQLTGQSNWQTAFTFTITGWGAGDSVQLPAGVVIDFGQVVSSPRPLPVSNNCFPAPCGIASDSRLVTAIRLTANTVGVACGEKHTLFLKRDGTVNAIGSPQSGQAVVPPGISNVVAIAAGTDHSLALTADGHVVAWGWNNEQQLSVPADLAKVIAIAAGREYSLALLANGTVRAWGGMLPGNNSDPDDDGEFNPPTSIRRPGTNPVVAIAGGTRHALALRANGSVVGWGDASESAAMAPPPGVGPLIAISAGSGFSVGLRPNGTVVAWGDNRYHQLEVPPGLRHVVALACGSYHTVALRAGGTVVAWGNNSAGQTTVPSAASNVVAIAAGGFHSEVLQATGPLLAGPRIESGQFGCDINLPAGQRFRLQGSPDLINWVTIQVDTAFPAHMRWQGLWRPGPSVFYRIKPVWPGEPDYVSGYQASKLGGSTPGNPRMKPHTHN